ncbi:MAG TPA: single-stranded DNA-binding protein, partial [Balneola sp.]|nr:single-stranded DNA-binding protein [Balneola sp.]
MNTLAQLKSNRQSNLNDLTKKIEEMNSSPQQQQSNNSDDNLWKPAVGKDGNGYAVIRFL